MTSSNWAQAQEAILDALDIQREFENLGVEIVGRQPNSKGWIACRAVGRPDRNPSAEINVGDPPGRGRYTDWATGERLSFFDFAAAYGPYEDWQAARKHYAQQAGVKLPKGGGRDRRPDDALKYQPWKNALVLFWCQQKPGITPAAIRRNGGQLAMWPKQKGRQQYPVVVLPIFGPQLLNDDPIGWVAWHRGGRHLPVWQGKGVPPKAVKMKTLAGSKSGLIGAHGLAALGEAEVVWKTEGPVDLLALFAAIPEELRQRHVVITNAGGAGEIPRPEWLEHLAGKTVYVIHDADHPGQGIPAVEQDQDRLFGARLWTQEIGRYAAACHNVQLPYDIAPNHGQDVRDYLCREDVEYTDLLALAAQTPRCEVPPPPSSPPTSSTQPESVPSASSSSPTSSQASEATQGRSEPLKGHFSLAVEQQILNALQIEVLGELENGRVKVFSRFHQKTEAIREVSRWTSDRILQLCGPVAKEVINLSGEHIPGQYSLQEIRNAVCTVAGYTRLDQVREVGRGVWRGKSPDGEETDAVVLVGAREAARINGDGELQRVQGARVDGLLLDIGINNESWYDHDQLKEYVVRAKQDKNWTRTAIKECVDLFRRWHWPDNEVCPHLMAGLVLASWVQTLWRWRPMVAVTGASMTGKSLLLEALAGSDSHHGLFGSLVVSSTKSTEAGIRQAVRNTSSILLLDEFEFSKERGKIMELFRASGRGGKVLRGTTGQEGQRYGLRHIPWMASIEVGLDREPDWNRVILLELLAPPADKKGKLTLPPEHVLTDLGQRLLGIAIATVRDAIPLAESLRACQHGDLSMRVVESYAVPTAMLAAALDKTDIEQATAVLHQLLKNVQAEESSQDDATQLLGDILSAHVDCGRGVRYTVSQILRDKYLHNDYFQQLQAHGIGLVKDRPGRYSDNDDTEREYLFVAPKVARRKLLRDTPWEGQSIDQILKRMEGAERGQHRIAQQKSRGIRLPLAEIEAEHFGDGQPEPPEELLF